MSGDRRGRRLRDGLLGALLVGVLASRIAADTEKYGPADLLEPFARVPWPWVLCVAWGLWVLLLFQTVERDIRPMASQAMDSLAWRGGTTVIALSAITVVGRSLPSVIWLVVINAALVVFVGFTFVKVMANQPPGGGARQAFDDLALGIGPREVTERLGGGRLVGAGLVTVVAVSGIAAGIVVLVARNSPWAGVRTGEQPAITSTSSTVPTTDGAGSSTTTSEPTEGSAGNTEQPSTGAETTGPVATTTTRDVCVSVPGLCIDGS